MVREQQELRPQERNVHPRCHFILRKDIVIVRILDFTSGPERTSLLKGTKLTLLDHAVSFCLMEKNGKICGGNGPVVRVEETKGVAILINYIGRSFNIPSEFLEVDTDELG